MSAARATLRAVPSAGAGAAGRARPDALHGPAEFFGKLLDPLFLAEAGWDAARQVLSVPSGHPLLGWKQCRVAGCHTMAYRSSGICQGCMVRMRTSGMAEDEFMTTTKSWRTVGVSACEVEGCQRPWRTSRSRLCFAHSYQSRKLRLPMPEFLAHAQVQPLPSLGPCQVASCLREQSNPTLPYCQAHRQQLRRARQSDPELDEQAWRRTAAAVAQGGEVTLRGLPSPVISQILYGLQQRTRAGTKTTVTTLRRLCDQLRAGQVTSIEQASGLTGGVEVLWRQMCVYVRRARLDPETEKRKDVWDTHVFGYGGNLDFTAIRQRWLREAAKRWAIEDLPRRRGDQVVGVVQSQVTSLAVLSESLHAGRPDHGNYPAALGRADMVAFLNRLAHLEHRGKLSSHLRMVHARDVRKILARLRAVGLTRPGEPMAGLPDDFALRPEDLPRPPEREEPGRDLPVEIMRQLCEHLPEIEKISIRQTRIAIELIIDTGRRPDEICELAWDCLARDPDGRPVLVYDNWKEQRMGRRLPIAKATAALITEQKNTVRARYPHAPVSGLKLLPSPVSNPEGRRAISDSGLGGRHRRWVDRLPELRRSDGTEFDKSQVVLYAYRHTYAQRHADAGVPVDVLRELMDHKSMDVTKGYYRVGEQRRREAVDKVSALQFDRHGTRVWQHAKQLLDAEHIRRAVGEVVVPFGLCAEPSNVKAGGHACPYRFRCVGCDHFRTDASYLPELQTYLDDLLRNRERLLAATDLDMWARAEAQPSDEEITRVRRLIARIKSGLDQLTDDERAQIDQAVTVVRRHRATMLGMPRTRHQLPEIRPERAV